MHRNICASVCCTGSALRSGRWNILYRLVSFSLSLSLSRAGEVLSGRRGWLWPVNVTVFAYALCQRPGEETESRGDEVFKRQAGSFFLPPGFRVFWKLHSPDRSAAFCPPIFLGPLSGDTAPKGLRHYATLNGESSGQRFREWDVLPRESNTMEFRLG